MSKKIWIGTMLWVLGTAGAQAEPSLRIRILEKKALHEVRLKEEGSNGGWTEIKLSRGILTVNGKAGKGLRFGSGRTIHLEGPGIDRQYPGILTLSVAPERQGDSIQFIDEVPLTDYVACVTAAESGFDRSQPEYLKALGLVIREYARSHRSRHPGYDLCDLAHCQVFQGLPSHFDSWKGIAEATQDYHPSLPSRSYYFHHCCGGTLESAVQVWGGVDGGSRTGPDQWDKKILCRQDPSFIWHTEIEHQKLEDIFRIMTDLPPVARLREFEVAARTQGLRVKSFRGTFETGSEKGPEVRVVKAQEFISRFGKRYGWRTFPSLLLEVTRDGNAYRLTGKGQGHGVGLCQAGAMELAKKGWNWERILDFYFPKAIANPRP